MSHPTLIEIFANLEAFHKAAAEEAAKAKKLIEQGGLIAPPLDQRGKELGAQAVAKRMKNLLKV